MSVDLGERLRSVRKRRGLTQPELADASGVSLSTIKKVEQGERGDIRLETLRKLAVGLRVRTSDLQVRHDAEHADPETVDQWEPVRRALAGQDLPPSDDEPVTVDGLFASLHGLRPALGQNRYLDVAQALPALLRDADELGDEGRVIRSRLLNLTGWLLVQARQFDPAEDALDRAVDTATDRLDAAAAIDTKLWSWLRQGRLDEARTLAIRWADDIEPRFSRATAAELSLWGRMWLRVATAAMRDAQSGETADALSLARAAAHRIGHEVYADRSTMKTFGPISVGHISAESHAVSGEPDKVLAIAARTPVDVLEPTAANRLRHRLDVASAHVTLGNFGDGVAELKRVQGLAGEWLPQQRYARDILGRIVIQRRTLTDDMRQLADAIKLEY